MRAQEQREHHEHQQQSLQTAVDQRCQAVCEQRRLVVPHRELDVFGVLGRGRGHIPPDFGRDLPQILTPHLGHAYQRRRTSIEPELLPGVGEAVDDARDVLQEHARAVVARGHLDPAEFLPAIRLPVRAQEEFAPFRLDRTAREVDGVAANGARDLIEGELVPLQGRFGDFDGNLIGPDVRHRRPRDHRQGQEVVAHTAGQLLQRPLVRRTRDGHLDHDVA